jgi:hypothetical protein
MISEASANSNVQCLCASAHNIGSLHRFCKARQIDDSTLCNQRQRLEARILTKLGWWMSSTSKTDKEKVSWVAYLEENQLTKMDPATQIAITDSTEDWLIAMRAIENSYVLLRKNADLQDKTPPGDLAFIGWVASEVNGGPGLRVVVNDDTSARWITWDRVARDGVYPMSITGKPSCYGMPPGANMTGYELGMD